MSLLYRYDIFEFAVIQYHLQLCLSVHGLFPCMGLLDFLRLLRVVLQLAVSLMLEMTIKSVLNSSTLHDRAS